MTTELLSPPRARFFNNNGTVAAGCLLYTYSAGSSTPKATYTDSAGLIAQANPIVLDAKGEAVVYGSGAYKLDLKTALGVQVTGYPVDNVIIDLRGTLSASSGAGEIGFIYTGSGAVATTLQAVARSAPIDGKLFADATGDGVTSDTADLQAALTAGAGGAVYIPEGTFMVAGLTVPDDTTVYGNGAGSILKKNANGPMITMGKRCKLINLALDGNGGSFTGTGVLISTGSLDNVSWRRINGVDIYNTESYCLEFSGATAGYASMVSDCRFYPTSTATYAIKLPTNAGVAESGGNRMFNQVWSFAARLMDLADSENTNITGCHGFWPKFGAATAKCSIVGGRLNLYDALAILTGTANTVSGCTINYNALAVLTIDAGCINCRFDSSNAIGSGATIVDNSDGNTSGNEIYIPRKVYTPTWAGSGGTPAIGNGSISGSWVRRGSMVAVTVSLTIGSTTNFNSATAWTFSVPYIASRKQSGSASILDFSATNYTATSETIANTATARVVTQNPGQGIGYLIPMTWATDDALTFDIEYEIK